MIKVLVNGKEREISRITCYEEVDGLLVERVLSSISDAKGVIWAGVRSCYGSGVWLGAKPWLGNDAWE